MSIKVMTKVWEKSQHCGSTLLMLLAIADNANDQGIAWPAIRSLAKKVRMKRRQAQRLIRELEESGELKTEIGGHIVGRPAGNDTNSYIINLKKLSENTGAMEDTDVITAALDKGVLQDTGVPQDTLDKGVTTAALRASSEALRASFEVRKGVMQAARTFIEPSLKATVIRTVKDIPMKKTKFGENQNVAMTEIEHQKLIDKFGADFTSKCIERLDVYKGATGKRYKSDYLAILNWVVDAVKRNANGTPHGNTTTNTPRTSRPSERSEFVGGIRRRGQ